MTKVRQALVLTAALSVVVGVLARDASAEIVDTFVWGRPDVVTIEVAYYPEGAVAKTEYSDLGVEGNLFVYQVTREGGLPSICLPDSPCGRPGVSLFSVPNPGGFSGTMFAPEGWFGSSDTQRFTWATSEPDDVIAGGESLLFLLFSPGTYGLFTAPPFPEDGIGQVVLTAWHIKTGEIIETETVFGPLSGPVQPSEVPEPSSLLLLGAGLLACARRLRPRNR